MLVHRKDPTPLEDKAGVVYKIPCSSCPKVYIGQTGRTLGQRVKEHQHSVRDKKIATLTLVEHFERTVHSRLDPPTWRYWTIVHTHQRDTL